MTAVTTPETVAADGLLLRPVEVDDAPYYLEALADPVLACFSPMPDVVTGGLPAARERCELLSDWSEGTRAVWSITSGGAFAGSISLYHLDHEQRNGEIGYWVLPSFRRQKVASRALAAVTGFGLGRLELARLVLYHAVENRPSCLVAEGGGYRFEGVHRRSFRYGDGLLHDEHRHVRLAGDQR